MIIKAVISAISVLFILWFSIPLATGIFNIGNFAGIIFFGLILILCIYINPIKKLLLELLAKNPSKALVITAISFIAIMLATALAVSALMVTINLKKPKSNSTLVVLGCQVRGESPSLMLKERLDSAYEYLNKNPKSYCVVSGGQGSNEKISEAECMYRYLIKKGISANRIYLEVKSTSTRENLSFSKEIIDKNNLPKDIVIVTNEFHEYRACLIAKKLNLEAYSYPAKTVWYLLPTFWVRDMFGVIYEYIF